jgi:FeS assembly SUF system regulator
MLRPSKLADYATVIMTALARDPDQLRNAADLAAEIHLAAPTVSKVLKRLAREGLLVSIRGAHGGYRLSRHPAEITMAQIIAALEGPLGLTDCAAHNGRCGIESLCHVRGNWLRINLAVQRALDGVTLASMAEPLPTSFAGEVPLRRAQPQGA